MSKKAQLSHTTPNHIFAESMSIVPHEILIELSKEDHVKRTIIRNHRDYNDSSSVLKILHLRYLLFILYYIIRICLYVN